MDGVCHNSIDAVSDRDFAIEFSAAASLAMVHVSRLSEELVLWMSQSFGFIEPRRPLHHRLVDHAAEEEPRRRPSSRAARAAASSAT